MRRSSRPGEQPSLLDRAHQRPSLLDRARERLVDDAGTASLEFLTVGVLLMVPLVYLVLALGQIQHAVLGIEGAARHAARVLAQAETHEAGMAAADRATVVALADAGLEPGAVEVAIACAPDPSACTTPRGTVTVRIDARVPLPLAPPVLELDVGVGVPVSAQATQPVSAFGSAP